MKKVLIVANICMVYLLSGALSLSIAYGQNKVTDTSATVVGYWGKGDTKKLIVKQGKEKNVNGKSSKEGSAYEATMKVLDETEKSYTIEWTYRNISVDSDNPLMKSLYKMAEGLKVIYKTDELGIFKELVNWEEMQSYLYKGLDKVEKEFGDNQAAKAVVKQFKGIYSTRESIESTLRDIQLYHTPYGAEYKLNEPITAETQLPNILGGDPFPARLEIQMTVLKPKENYCKIVTKQEIDKERASKIIFEFIKKMAEKSGKPLPKDTEIPVITTNDISEHEIELAEGWVKRAYYKREMQSGQVKQIETYEITLKQ